MSTSSVKSRDDRQTWRVTDLKSDSLDLPTNAQVIGSYNWKAVDPRNRSAPPTIIVPGVPRVLQTQYRNKKLTQLVRDEIKQGQADENAFRCPDFPLEPLFLAVKECSPEFKMKDVDIISDRNNMRKLLKFAAGIPQDDFEIRLSVLGKKAVVFERVESDGLDNQIAGFGRSFEDWITTRPNPISNESFRVVSNYNLGPLNLIVRHEVDAVETLPSNPRGSDENHCVQNDIDSPVKMVREGTFFKEISGVELKSKSSFFGNFDYPDLWSQMIFSGVTRKAIIGFHSRGKLSYLEPRSLDSLTTSVQHSKHYRGFTLIVPILEDIINYSRESIIQGDIGVLKYVSSSSELSFFPKIKQGYHLSSGLLNYIFD